MPELTEQIITEFERLCAIPRRSGEEHAVGCYLKERLAPLASSLEQDAAGNLRADIPAHDADPGTPLVILQAHMDMVVAVAGTQATAPGRVTLVRESGILKSDGRTSLGADNGIGVTAILVLLTRNDFPHGPVRVLLTVSEETGLRGAAQVPESWLRDAAFLINTDGFHSGTVLTGCKSGRRETFSRYLSEEPVPCTPTAFRISLEGFLGGHSGDDIGRGRCNTIQTLALILRELGRKLKSLRICSLQGGTAFNVIPASCTAVLLTGAADAGELPQLAREISRPLLAGYQDTGFLSLQPCACPAACWSTLFQRDTLDFLTELVNGICVPGRDGRSVSSSCNLGRVFVRDGTFLVQDMVRCDTTGQEEALAAQHRLAAQHGGYIGQVTGYHSWYSDPDSALARTAADVYRHLTGQTLERKVAQVGLETAYFQEKAPGLQMVCLGAEIQNAHAVSECVREDSISILARLIQGILADLPERTDMPHERSVSAGHAECTACTGNTLGH